MNYWEKLIEGFSFKSKGGAPDFSNPNDRLLLRMELMKKGWTDEAVNEFLHEVDLVRKKQADGSFGSSYPVKQYNPDRGQKLVKKDASAKDVKKALGVKDDDDLQKGKDEKPRKVEPEKGDSLESKEDDRYLNYVTKRKRGSKKPDDIELGLGQESSQAGEAAVVDGMKKATKTWEKEFGRDPNRWNEMSYEDKKGWLRNNFLSRYRNEMLEVSGTWNEKKKKYENNKETYLEPEWVESAVNSLERILIQDNKDNPEAIGIENISNIGWDTKAGRKEAGISQDNDKAAEDGPGDMFIKTKDGSVIALSLKKDGKVALANKTYKQEFPKIVESMRKQMLSDGMSEDEVNKILKDFEDTAGLQVWQKGIQDAQDNLEKELLDKGSQTRKDLIATLGNAKELYTRAKNGDKEAEEQFLKLTGKKNLENGFNYLKPYLGDESTWGGKSTEQLFDDYLSTGKLSKTANHVKGILRYIVNGTSKDNPNYDKSRELYNEFRQWEHKLTDEFYGFLQKDKKNERVFKRFLLGGIHLDEVLGFKDAGGVDSLKVLFGSGEKGEGSNELGSMMDVTTFTNLFFGDGQEKDLALSLIGKSRDSNISDDERKESQQEVLEMVMDKLEVDYETNTIGIRHPNGYYPLFNTKARSRGLPTPPQLEILHTDYTAKALQHGWNPNSWPPLIQKNFYTKLKKEAEEDLKNLTADGASFTQEELDSIQKRISSLEKQIKSVKK